MKIPEISSLLAAGRAVWVVTGAAGFIGSNLVEFLLRRDQRVVGLDNFSTGFRKNLQDVEQRVGFRRWGNFRFLEGDVRDLHACHTACAGADYVLHQAALGSVPRSLEDPVATNQSNVDGFLHMLVAARDAKVRRFVYAASSSTYGDHTQLPKVEEEIGRPLSPYAVTKLVNELYARVFEDNYGIPTVGLCYFNVFGRRQDPAGAYAAVIPRWIGNLLEGKPCGINGDGETSRDFCYIDNAVQANVLGALVEGRGVTGEVYNVAVGERTTLNELFAMIRNELVNRGVDVENVAPVYREFRAGDVRHSQADITKARTRLGFAPTHTVQGGLRATIEWYTQTLAVA